MKTYWETWNNGVPHEVHVGPNNVTVSEGSGFTGIGSEYPHQEFLASKHPQQMIAVAHGPGVLAEVIAAVQAASSHAPFVKERSEEQEHLERFKAFPWMIRCPHCSPIPRSACIATAPTGRLLFVLIRQL